MRANYDAHGVDGYYQAVHATYRNPHYPGVVEGVARLMDRAAGVSARSPNAATSNQKSGAKDMSSTSMTTSSSSSSTSTTTHQNPLRILDLACGSGEATLALEHWHKQRAFSRPLIITACDPYTAQAYRERTGRACSEWSFRDVMDGILLENDNEGEDAIETPLLNNSDANSDARNTHIQRKPHDVCICSFALHLLTPSQLHATCTQLALACRLLIVLSPHKRPHITSAMGWECVETVVTREMRVHAWLYRALL